MTMIAGVLWGTSFVTIQMGLDDGFNPVVFVAVRFIIAFASALVVVSFIGPLNAGLLKNPWVWGLGLTNTSGFLFQYFSLGLTVATKAALITNLSLIMVAPMSYYFLKERFTPLKLGALVMTIPGIILLTTGGDLASLKGSEFLGDMLSLAAGFSWAFYIIISKLILQDPKVSVSSLTLWVMGTTAALVVPLGIGVLALGGASLGDVGNLGWGMAVYTGIFCSTVAYLFWTRGLRGVTATVSAVLLLVMVIVAAIMDYLFFDTEMGSVPWIGAGILLVAMLMMSLAPEDVGTSRE
jgi:drug/metabolite transporter (DMT)-like permease